jgi:TolB-like protein
VRKLAALLLLILLVSPVAQAATRTVAVLPLSKGAAGPELDGFGVALADMMVTDLSTVPGLQLVERQRLADVLAELELGETDFIDESSAQELGHGLGAELVVVGSFSAVQGTLVIDSRVVAVATGAVLKAARAEGAVADFVSIEKEVVEGLVDGLQVELSRAERRKLLLQAPTEDFEAFASYGRGVKAKQEGQVDVARAAFEEALRRDPEFGRAAEELAALAVMVRTEREKERERAGDARTQTLYRALEQLPSELTREQGFGDTRQSLMDQSLRLALLRGSGQHCQRFEEQLHFLVRRDGEFTSWWEDLADEPMKRYERAEERFEVRVLELGLVGKGTWFGSRKGDAMRRGGMELGSGVSLLLSRSMTPEKSKDSIIWSMERCFPPEVRAAKWQELRRAAEGWSFYDEPLFSMWDGSQVTLTARDSTELYAALLRATHLGVDGDVTRITGAVLARHPEGDGDRKRVLSRIQTIVYAGQAYERRLAGHLGMTAEALAGATRAVAVGDGALLRMDVPLCATMVERRKDRTDDELERYEERRTSDRESDRLDAGVSLGSFLAPLVIAGCMGGADQPLKPEEALPAIRQALQRRHPGTLDDEACGESVEEFGGYVDDAAQERLLALGEHMRIYTVEGLLHQLHSLHWRRCLVP